MDAGGDELHRVAEQVGKDLGQSGFVADYAEVADFQRDIGGGRLEVRIGLDQAAQKVTEVHGPEGQFFTQDPAVVERVGDELVHALGRKPEFAEEVGFGRLQARGGVFLQKGGVGLHGSERGAHVVDQALGEAFELGNGVAEFGGAFLDGALQVGGVALQFGFEAPALEGLGQGAGDGVAKVDVDLVVVVALAAGKGTSSVRLRQDR